MLRASSVIAVLLVACDARVSVEDHPEPSGGAGAGAAGPSSTGSTNPRSAMSSASSGEGPRSIEVQWHSAAPKSIHFHWTAVILNDEDGSLVEVIDPATVPRSIEVTDGQLLTFLRWDQPTSTLDIESFRITPGVTRVVGWPAEDSFNPDPPFGGCDQVLFELAVTAPDDAAHGFALLKGGYAQNGFQVGAAQGAGPPDVYDWTCEEPIDLLILGAKEWVGEIVGYKLVQGIPLPGEGETPLLTVELTETGRAPAPIQIDGLNGAETVFGTSGWAWDFPSSTRPPAAEWIAAPVTGESMLLELAPIFPAGPGVGVTRRAIHVHRSAPTGACGASSGYEVREPAPGTPKIASLDSLAPMDHVGAASWSLAEEGAVGDIVTIAASLSHDPEDFDVWYLHEDPSWGSPPIVFPTLPTELHNTLVPSQAPKVEGAVHRLLDLSYADVLAGEEPRESTWHSVGVVCD